MEKYRYQVTTPNAPPFTVRGSNCTKNGSGITITDETGGIIYTTGNTSVEVLRLPDEEADTK